MEPVSVHGRSLILLFPGRDDALRERWGDLPLARYLTTHDVELATGEAPFVLECPACAGQGRRYAWCYVPGEDMMLAVSKTS
jgi:hypothetical protein